MISESPINCPECKSGSWKRYYTDEQLEEMCTMVKMQLMKQVICNNCNHIWDLSTFDVIKHFTWLKKQKGKSEKEIKKEITDKIDELKRK